MIGLQTATAWSPAISFLKIFTVAQKKQFQNDIFMCLYIHKQAKKIDDAGRGCIKCNQKCSYNNFVLAYWHYIQDSLFNLLTLMAIYYTIECGYFSIHFTDAEF
jgi:hypothetical protein